MAFCLGKVDMLIGLPLSINIAFATALVPSITESITRKKEELAKNKIAFSLKTSLLIALPCTFGLFLLAGPILELLFHGQLTTSPESELLLRISSFTILFTVMNQTINASLQGLGKIYVPAIALLVGAIVKYIINVTLIRIPQINVYGAAIGSVVCHLIATIIVSIILSKTIKLNIKIKDLLLKPLLSVFIMSVFVMFSYYLGHMALGDSRINTIIALLVAVISYFIAVVKLNVYSKNDYLLLPAGEKIYKILTKLKLVKDKI